MTRKLCEFVKHFVKVAFTIVNPNISAADMNSRDNLVTETPVD
jgi:hypothetical protein